MTPLWILWQPVDRSDPRAGRQWMAGDNNSVGHNPLSRYLSNLLCQNSAAEGRTKNLEHVPRDSIEYNTVYKQNLEQVHLVEVLSVLEHWAPRPIALAVVTAVAATTVAIVA